ncbi:MAG: hypothetical protein AB7O56_14545 [Bauldia sp.]
MPDKIGRYRLALEECLLKAERCPNPETEALWQTIADSYRYLIGVETRLAAHARGPSSADLFATD